MRTKRAGQILTVIGLVVTLVSISIDKFDVGKDGFGVVQLSGLELGLSIIFIAFLLMFIYQDREVDILGYLRGLKESLLNLPVAVWICVGFFIVYLAFFLFPTFLNFKRSFWYFIAYLPDQSPIGLDIRDILAYIENWLTTGKSPYYDEFLIYPPLGLLLLAPLSMLRYPDSYFVITFLNTAIYLVAMLIARHSPYGRRITYLLVAVLMASLFSYGFQFELERGQFNLIAFSLCLIAVILFHSSDRHAYLSYFLFTAGVQMKIYPAILVLMFVKDWRDWRTNLKRLTGITVLNLSLLFVAGFGIFADFWHALGTIQTLGSRWYINNSVKTFVNILVTDGFNVIDPDVLPLLQQRQGGVEFALMILMGLCILSIVVRSYIVDDTGFNPILLLVCAICAILIPSISYDYKIPILTIPISLVWGRIVYHPDKSKNLLIIIMVLVTSLCYWSVQYPPIVKPYPLTNNFAVLLLLMITVTLLNFLMPSSNIDSVKENL